MAEYNSDRTGANIDATLDKVDVRETVIDINNNTTRRISVNDSGAVFIGKSVSNIAFEGAELFPDNRAAFTRDSGYPLLLNRTGSDGKLLDFRKDGSTVGSIGANTGDMYLGTGDTFLRFNDGLDAVLPATSSGAGRDNTTDLGYSGGRFKDLYLSGGVYLGGTGAANKLDDYETGTFTPTVNSGTLTVNDAVYTKVGRMVHLSADILLSGTRTSTQLIIGGLPFRVNEGSWAGGQSYAQNVNVEFDKFLFLPSATGNRFSAVIQVIKINGTGGTAVGTDFGNGYFNISATYTTDE